MLCLDPVISHLGILAKKMKKEQLDKDLCTRNFTAESETQKRGGEINYPAPGRNYIGCAVFIQGSMQPRKRF